MTVKNGFTSRGKIGSNSDLIEMKETMFAKGKNGRALGSAEIGCSGAVLFMCVDRGLRVEPSGVSPQPTAHS